MKKFFAVVASLITVSLPVTALAQTASPQPSAGFGDAAKQAFENRFACMDNYNFNSVAVTVDPAKSVLDHQYLPGETIAVAGTIKNPNNYPLVGGMVYAHVLREDAKTAPENWHPYVSQEFVPGAYDVPANQTIGFTYSYRIPQGSPAGTYRIELYYLVGNRYVMSGIPYVANFTAASAPFTIVRPTITGGNAGHDVAGFVFDRNSVKVNGKNFQLREIPPTFESGKPVAVNVDLRAIGKSKVSGTVTMDLYAWSITDQKKPIISQSMDVVASPTKATPITFTWDSATPGTYELVLTSTTKDVEDVPSVLDVRFPVAGLVPRIVYSGIGAIKDGVATINACIVNATFGSGTGSMTNSLLINGKEVQTKDAAVSADQLSTALISEPLADLAGKAFDVHVVAHDANGNVADETTVSYPAGIIAGAQDTFAPTPASSEGVAPTIKPMQYILIGVVIIVIVLLIAIFNSMRLRKKKYPTL
ncbi:MAG TPA: hypothetical protein VLG69_02475 [Candidatus Andersenbacteria bacterium]|nr:hypothetical protein [Candidatus Andersenbacteria bacterium]